jgi:hypothetical protein
MPILLPFISPFAQPYEVWTSRDATHEEMLASMQAGQFAFTVNDKLVARITNEYEAAEYMANCGGVDNGLEFHIDRVLAADPVFQQWLRAMPETTPAALEAYRHEYPLDDYGLVDLAIRTHGASLSADQLLFHGGHIEFPSNGKLVTTRPLSATFCPQVALREAEWRGKAYEAGLVCIYLLRVRSSDHKVFVFDPDASDKGNEKEVLLTAGTKLNLRSARVLRNDYTVQRWKDMRTESKSVPFYLCEVDVV